MNLSDKFFKAFLSTLMEEGQYINDPDDPGGETKYGISKRKFEKLEIKDLTLDNAMALYYNNYWNEHIEKLPCQKLINKIFSTMVNVGKVRGTEIIQFTMVKYYSAAVRVDGIFGPATARMIGRLCHQDKQKELIKLYSFEVAKYYDEIGNKKYLRGWILRALE